jgi:hypothetical protein
MLSEGRQRLHSPYCQSARHMNGRAEEQGTVLRPDTPTTDAKIDVPTDLVREAAANSGNVAEATWKAAQQVGRSDEQLTDAFADLGAAVVTGSYEWMPCGRSSGADAAAPWESSLDPITMANYRETRRAPQSCRHAR